VVLRVINTAWNGLGRMPRRKDVARQGSWLNREHEMEFAVSCMPCIVTPHSTRSYFCALERSCLKKLVE